MDPILYSAISGGGNDFKRQEISANNLANINTPGFKADLYSAQNMQMDNGAKSLNGNSYSKQQANGIDLSQGSIMTTGRDLDVAIDGNGWIAVKDSHGKEAYTRGGSLHIDANGQLVTASGRVIIGDGGPISIPPSRSIEIGNDGTISVLPLEGDMTALAVLDRIKLVELDKANVYKTDEGLMQVKEGNAKPAASTVKVVNGALEASNVNAITQMVGMISSGREFEAQMKILSSVDDNGQKLAQVLHQ
ncbi:MAG: flagellar basal-body rod protein FlgF [Legionella sp.]|nr:MAG: flagellar basal-body rod protein FlgF [Legionella sp.]